MENFTTCSNLYVTSLVLSGFVEVAGPAGKEYLFIVDVTWSDNRSLTVKRTYKDFINFRTKLVNAAKREKCNVNIPILQGKHNSVLHLNDYLVLEQLRLIYEIKVLVLN